MSDNKRIQRTVFAALICLALLGAVSAVAEEDALPLCDAIQLPDNLSRTDGVVEVETKLPNTLGTLISIEVEGPSGLSVTDPEALDSERIHFAIDTSSAKSGTWSLVFRGEESQCRAVLEVL